MVFKMLFSANFFTLKTPALGQVWCYLLSQYSETLKKNTSIFSMLWSGIAKFHFKPESHLNFTLEYIFSLIFECICERRESENIFKHGTEQESIWNFTSNKMDESTLILKWTTLSFLLLYILPFMLVGILLLTENLREKLEKGKIYFSSWFLRVSVFGHLAPFLLW